MHIVSVLIGERKIDMEFKDAGHALWVFDSAALAMTESGVFDAKDDRGFRFCFRAASIDLAVLDREDEDDDARGTDTLEGEELVQGAGPRDDPAGADAWCGDGVA